MISENNGSTNGITPKDIADKINEEYSQYENVHAEDEMNFPTKIIFPEEGDREVEIDLNGSTGGSDNIYDADVSEEDIAPTEIFKYEIISDAETGATSLDSLPTKEARITGIKEKYCNGVTDGGYDEETGENYEDTNYEIVLDDGSRITDTLVIPYQVEIDGEMYRITEANITAIGKSEYGENGAALPKVKTIIYPNTIDNINSNVKGSVFGEESTLTNVILSNNLQKIGDYAFVNCIRLTSVNIPSSVTSIGNYAFMECSSLTSINIPNTVTTIGESTFSGCTSLTSIEIPSSVTSIESYAFSACSSLTTINYTGTMEQWQQISGKDNLYGVQIICTDGTINP